MKLQIFIINIAEAINRNAPLRFPASSNLSITYPIQAVNMIPETRDIISLVAEYDARLVGSTKELI